MAIRIWYQSFGLKDAMSAYHHALIKQISRVADPEVEVTTHGIKRSIFEGKGYRVFLPIDIWQVVENIVTAEQEGYDAVAVGNFLDPGVDEGREAVNIPVLGLCETSLLYASTLAPKFSLIHQNDKWRSTVRERVVKYGLQDKIASEATMQLSIPLMVKSFTDSKSNDLCMQPFKEEVRKMIASGTELIIPSSGLLMALLVHNDLYEISGIPILDGVSVLIKWAEMAVKLNRITGICVSRGATYKSAPKEALKKMKEVYGPWNLG